jgi:hypothetical protein
MDSGGLWADAGQSPTKGGTTAPARSAPGGLDLGRVLELLRTHIIAALCRTVFASVRITERQRRWKSLAHVRGGRKILKLT